MGSWTVALELQKSLHSTELGQALDGEKAGAGAARPFRVWLPHRVSSKGHTYWGDIAGPLVLSSVLLFNGLKAATTLVYAVLHLVFGLLQ